MSTARSSQARHQALAGRVWLVLLGTLATLVLSGCYHGVRELAEIEPYEPGEEGLGVDLGPEQPINFSHRIHAGEYGVECQYCHNVADKSPTAGIPAVEVCMGCHVVVKTESEEIQKIHGYWERGEAIPWVRVHNIADHVQFRHSPHIGAGVACQECHGPVEDMDRIFRVASLKMGWCLNCHGEDRDPDDIAPIADNVPADQVGVRQPHGFYPQFMETTYGETRAPRDCAACHY